METAPALPVYGETADKSVFIPLVAYDPWGRTRNALTWAYNNPQPLSLIYRGFTGHEMLPEFQLINMNGRMYDPILGVMLSPDNFVQNPEYSQSFNRYTYALNNPLKYVDPSGYYSGPCDGCPPTIINNPFIDDPNYGNDMGYMNSITASSVGGYGGGDPFMSYAGGTSSSVSNYSYNWLIYSYNTYNYSYSSGLSGVAAGFAGGTGSGGYVGAGTYTGPRFITVSGWQPAISRPDPNVANNAMRRATTSTASQTNWGLYLSGVAFTAEGLYSSYLHNHIEYITTKGVIKPIYKPNGLVRSSRAAQFASTSSLLKTLGNIGTGLMTATAGYNIYTGNSSLLDYSDFSVGTIGLINAGALQWTSYGIPVIGQAVAFYSGARLFFDATSTMTNYYIENKINPGMQFVIFKE